MIANSSHSHLIDGTARCALATHPMNKHPFLVAAALAAGSLSHAADNQPADPSATPPATASTALPAVEVSGFRGVQAAGVKYTRPLQDTLRIVSVLPAALLEEQGATTLKDALRNIPGISLQAGEGNPPGGDQLKIRGFNAPDDINVNGSRDLGNYFRDPFYIDQLEVVKGPNSAFSGRGSAGGTINFVTKAPTAESFGRVEASLGSDAQRRLTLDLNRPLDDHSALRLNLMAHDADMPGRDRVHEVRQGLYAAYAWGLKGDTAWMWICSICARTTGPTPACRWIATRAVRIRAAPAPCQPGWTSTTTTAMWTTASAWTPPSSA